jgi:DNA adenine methylase
MLKQSKSKDLKKSNQNPTISKLLPLVKWPGGKTSIAPLIAEHYDRQFRYVSLFAGGLGDVMAIAPDRALINDCWQPIINLYQQIQDGLEAIAYEGTKERYYLARDEFNSRLGERTPEMANLLYFLLRTGFNGLVRTNSKGWLNVPFGKPAKGEHKYISDFSEYRAAFGNWQFTNLDFEEVPIAPDDFLYADPPYDIATANGKSFKYSNGFDWDDQVRLAHFLASKPNPVVASNHATTRVIELYSDLGFQITTFHKTRAINCKGEGRKNGAIEMLATKNTKKSND